VKEVLAIFDAPDYHDDNAASHKVIVELMSEVQSYGSPPADLMGPLPLGVDLGPDGLPQLGENCVIG
jgi:peroxin-19